MCSISFCVALVFVLYHLTIRQYSYFFIANHMHAALHHLLFIDTGIACKFIVKNIQLTLLDILGLAPLKFPTLVHSWGRRIMAVTNKHSDLRFNPSSGLALFHVRTCIVFHYLFHILGCRMHRGCIDTLLLILALFYALGAMV